MKIAVFCSSSERVSPIFFSEIDQLGEGLALDGHSVIYGGAALGCMGALARGVLRGKGRLIGVVPELDFMSGIVEPGLHERHDVMSLAERKTKMLGLADAVLVFPGGLGTLDEAFEALALKSAGTLCKPIIFYNFLGVWSPLLEALELLVEQNLVKVSLAQLLHVMDKTQDIREHFKNGVGTP